MTRLAGASGGYLVLERSGSLWGIAGRQVQRLGRPASPVSGNVASGNVAAGGGPTPGPVSPRPVSGAAAHGSDGGVGEAAEAAAPAEGLRLEVPGGELAADRVLAVVPDLRVWPAPGALVRFGSSSAVGLAVFADRPVLVFDGDRPPEPLRAPAPEAQPTGSAEDATDGGGKARAPDGGTPPG